MACGDKHLKEAMIGANYSLGLYGDTMSDWSSKNPYMSEITENYILKRRGLEKRNSTHCVRIRRLRTGLQSR